MWERTSTINKHTQKPNWGWYFEDGSNIIVYKRLCGWSYTIRIPAVGDQWLQLSTDSHHGFNTAAEAKEESLLWAEKFRTKITDITTVRKSNRGGKLPDDVLESMGFTRAELDAVWGDED